ncbi:DegV family protein [Dysosmobacter sp. HCP28S3_G4]|uniref:DegV family protein n=1 Tax=Dysosmobacter sp. HCP28S3_G4 TaxID=3438938 RepID=UPI003F8AE21F
MTIKITTDSTCDLPAALLEQRNITVAPLGVAKGGKLYHDGVDISIWDIAAHVDGGGEITTTSAVNIADYETLFAPLSERYDAVIHINLGSGFSSCHQNARAAAQEFGNVYVVDSGNLSSGHGLVVLAASDAAAAGKSPAEILTLLEKLIPRVEASFVMDRLEYMKKGGRCSAVLALGANLLRLHPGIQVIDGKMSVVKKYRGTMEKAIADYIHDRLDGRTDIDTSRAVLVDCCRAPGLVETARDLLRADGRFGEIIEAKAGCTIFSHCGPDTLGIMFLRR